LLVASSKRAFGNACLGREPGIDHPVLAFRVFSASTLFI
jgi:hypothetical protein